MPTEARKIIHVDMDAFFASVEQRDNPRLRGRPVAVGNPRGRGVVCAASYEARRHGVHSALPSSLALKRCPGLIFVPPRFERYEEVSSLIREIFLEYTDLVEPLSLDEAFLDVTRNRSRLISATLIAREIKNKIRKRTGLTASAGVSINKFLAKVASDFHKPDGLTVIGPEKAEAFAAALPVGKIPGIGKVTLKKLEQMRIHTGADLAERGEEELLEAFGKFGLLYRRLARGIDESPVIPDRPRKSLGAETTFPRDISARAALEGELEKICAEVSRRLGEAGLRGETVTVKIKYHDFRQVTRSRTLGEPVFEADEIRETARLLLLSPPPPDPVRLLGVSLSNLSGPGCRGLQLTFLKELQVSCLTP